MALAQENDKSARDGTSNLASAGKQAIRVISVGRGVLWSILVVSSAMKVSYRFFTDS